jgi:hypothetical protein
LTTDWVTTPEVEDRWFELPTYVAVIVREPVAVNDVVHVAIPEALSVGVPEEQLMVAEPSLKETAPVGTPPPGATGATVAENVTLCPVVTVAADVVRLVVVEAALTTWVTAAEVEDPWLAEPAYVAVMPRVPAEPWATTQVAAPELRVWVPPVHARVVAPSLKVTLPAGVPPPGATADTVAV